MSTISTLASLQPLAELINRANYLVSDRAYLESQVDKYPHLHNQLTALDLKIRIFSDEVNTYMSSEVKGKLKNFNIN